MKANELEPLVTDTTQLGDLIIQLSVTKDVRIRNRYLVTAKIDDEMVGYCNLAGARNHYTSGYRITNYTAFERGLGIGPAMVDFFEQHIGRVLPSGVFGAKGKLTDDGKAAAIKRLSKRPPDWLPDGWENEFVYAKMA